MHFNGPTPIQGTEYEMQDSSILENEFDQNMNDYLQMDLNGPESK